VPDLVFAQLRDAILSGRYEPGERLPTQRTLAAELEVNMATVREALGRLEQLRLLEIRHGDAMRVRDWRRSGGLEVLALLAGLEEEVREPLFEARRLLLVEAARLAAERSSEEQSRRLHQLAAAFAAANRDSDALLADWAFMSAVIEAARNLVFQLIMNSVRELYLPNASRFERMVSDRSELAPLYREVAESISRGDGSASASAIGRLALAQESRVLEDR
jgi:DNA-binding FadR family transcriptional regulator